MVILIWGKHVTEEMGIRCLVVQHCQSHRRLLLPPPLSLGIWLNLKAPKPGERSDGTEPTVQLGTQREPRLSRTVPLWCTVSRFVLHLLLSRCCLRSVTDDLKLAGVTAHLHLHKGHLIN